MIKIYECGACGFFHEIWNEQGGSLNPHNDCRYDDNRFISFSDYAKRKGVNPDDVIEVMMDDEDHPLFGEDDDTSDNETVNS